MITFIRTHVKMLYYIHLARIYWIREQITGPDMYIVINIVAS